MFDCKRNRQDMYPPQSEQTERARETSRRAKRQVASNQGLQRMLAARAIQPKLAVSEPGDKYEREAERVAEAVMRMPDPEAAGVNTEEAPDHIQRMCPRCQRRYRQGKPLNCEECEAELQRKEASSKSPVIDAKMGRQIESLRGDGRPLPESVRSFFEPRFGQGFADVRIHTDRRSDGAARAIDAEAFTIGKDVVFRSGAYRPGMKAGKKLLAHELAHVIQQRNSSDTLSRQANEAEQGYNAQFLDCTEETAEVSNPSAKLQRASQDAVAAIDWAIHTIETYIHAEEPDESVRHAFGVHFMMPDYNQMETILATYRRAKRVLERPDAFPGRFVCNSNESIYCDPDEHGVKAYVFSDPAYIHICPAAFDMDERSLWDILIHEAAHIVGASEDCYQRDACYRSQPSAEAVQNADSYAGFAVELVE